MTSDTIFSQKLPSMKEIFTSPVSTVTFLPKAVRAVWGKEFVKVASDAMFHNDELHFTRLAMFSQATLAAPKRGGKKNTTAAEFISSNLGM